MKDRTIEGVSPEESNKDLEFIARVKTRYTELKIGAEADLQGREDYDFSFLDDDIPLILSINN